MAVPEIVAETENPIGPGSATGTVTLPSDIVSGQLLLCWMGIAQPTPLTWDNSTAGTWTLLASAYSQATRSVELWGKVADGTESGAVLSLSGFGIGSREHFGLCLQIQNWEGTIGGGLNTGVAVYYNSASNSNYNPNQANDSWGSVERMTLVLTRATRAYSATEVAHTQPSGYTLTGKSGGYYRSGAGTSQDGTWSCKGSYSYKTGTEGSQDPGAGVHDYQYPHAVTLSIQGGTSGGVATQALAGTIAIASSIADATLDVGTSVLLAGTIASTSSLANATLTTRALTSNTTATANTGVTEVTSNAGTTTAATNTGVTTDGS